MTLLAGALIIIAILILIVALILLSHGADKNVRAVASFTFTHISHEGNMEKFKATWTPSPDTFVEKHNLVYQFPGGAEVVGPDLPSSAIETYVTFEGADLGSTGSVWVRTTGDNGTVDNCNKLTFTVSNSQTVRPVENFAFTYVGHVD